MKDLQKYIDVIAAHMKGEKIEMRETRVSKEWQPAHSPTWNFQDFEYRVAQEPTLSNPAHPLP